MVCLYFSPSPRLIKVGMLNYNKYISNQMNLIFTFHRCDSVSFCIIVHSHHGFRPRQHLTDTFNKLRVICELTNPNPSRQKCKQDPHS